MATNAQIFEIRTLIRDPIDSFNSIVEVANVAALPSSPIAQTLYFVADIKEYQLYEDGAWARQYIAISNDRIAFLYDLYADVNKVCAKLVTDLINLYVQMNARAYKSHDNGSEKFTTYELSEILSVYRAMRDSFNEEYAESTGSSTGFYAVTKKPNVGGMDL